MEKKISSKTKQIEGIILIITAFILLYNTNNNPTILIGRILKPIKIWNVTLLYAGIIPILLIYYGLKIINKRRGYKLLKTRIRRIIVTLIILNFGIQLCTNAVKFIKGMSKGLNSVYYHREGDYNSLSLRQLDNKNIIFTCTIDLENCSKMPQKFEIAILIPEDFKELVQEEIILKDSEL